MTVARAFGYLRYNPDEVGDPGKLLAPPYDVIDEAQRQQLVSISPYQSTLVELPEGGDNEVAGKLFREWIASDVLEGGEIGIAVLKQRYVGPDGVRRTRIGVECEIKLVPFDEKQVLPHEQTFERPKLQRLDLMDKTNANISPVFVVYHDTEQSLHDLLSSATDDEPDFTSSDEEGTQTAVWFITDPAICERFESAVNPHKLLIADGHHRYTAALSHRERAAAGGARLSMVGGSDYTGAPHTDSTGVDGVLAVVANSADEGMCIFPTHRVLGGVAVKQLDDFVLGSGAFRVDIHADLEDAMFQLDQLKGPGFVVYQRGRARCFSVTDPTDLELATPGSSDAYRSLDVVALHSLVIDGGALLGPAASETLYTRSISEAQELVESGEDRIAFLLRGAEVGAVHDVAANGELLPQKSTYFYPKVPTGVLFRSLDPLV